jgi:GTP-binding protein
LTRFGWAHQAPQDDFSFDVTTPRLFTISALTGEGTKELTTAIMKYLDIKRAAALLEAQTKPSEPAAAAEVTQRSGLIQKN